MGCGETRAVLSTVQFGACTREKGGESSRRGGGGEESRERALGSLTPHLDSTLGFNWPAGGQGRGTAGLFSPAGGWGGGSPGNCSSRAPQL